MILALVLVVVALVIASILAEEFEMALFLCFYGLVALFIGAFT